MRYYLEVARAGSYSVDEAVARIDVVTPDEVREIVEARRPVVVVGMHFGAIELPAILVVHLLGQPVTAPMELVANPMLREWFLRNARKHRHRHHPDRQRPTAAAGRDRGGPLGGPRRRS